MFQSITATLCVEAETGRLRYSDHYADQLFSRPTPNRLEIRFLLCDDAPAVIEDYLHDPRGRSCLIWGIMGNHRVGHILCSAPPNSLVVTAYWPAETEPDEWEENYQRRRRPPEERMP
jgi:hypothetical protein